MFCLKKKLLYCCCQSKASIVRMLEILNSQIHFHFEVHFSKEQAINLTLHLDPWRRQCFSSCTVHVSPDISMRRWWPYSSQCLPNNGQMAKTSLTTPRWRIKKIKGKQNHFSLVHSEMYFVIELWCQRTLKKIKLAR